MIKIYTIREYLNSENRRRIFPLLFDVAYLKTQKSRDNYFIVDDIVGADVAIFPIDTFYLFNENICSDFREFIKNAKKNNIPIWIYAGGDFGKTFTENLFTFRLGGFKSKLGRKTYIMPCFVSDPYSTTMYGREKYITKSNLPNIGFVGQANNSIDKLAKDYLIHLKLSLLRLVGKDSSDFQNFYPSSLIRLKILRKLQINSAIDCNFIVRKNYRAAAKTEEDIKSTTHDFYDNIQSNLYTLCIRGAGNFSVRFYETLIMGRIPILIDTDVELPLSDIIKWENHIIFATMKNVERKVLDFHLSKSNEELIEIQISNRKLVMEKLNREDYFIEVSKKSFNK